MTETQRLPWRTQAIICLLATPSGGGRIVDQVNTWIQESGVEWTVNRLKAYLTIAKQLRAGNHSIVKKIYQDESIAYYKGSLLPRGPMKLAVAKFQSAQRATTLKRAGALLRFYTSLTLEDVSDAQFDKANKAINSTSTGDAPFIGLFCKTLSDVVVGLRLPKPKLRSLDLNRLKAYTSCHRVTTGHSMGLRDKPYGLACQSLLTSCYIPHELVEVLDQDLNDFRSLLIEMGSDADASGHISFIQEAGAKCRVVAVPNAWIQLIYEPIHHYLDGLVKGLIGSCVHDQNKGAFLMEASLTSGKTLYCFDLSSATDRFPLQLQTQVLESLGLSTYARGLETLSQGWDVGIKGRGNLPFWNYETGQPMGLYGSFPLFHYTHWLVLFALATASGSFKRCKNPFMVLGDDVMILDQKLAHLYSESMIRFGVDVSPTKSISSSKVAEFAGFIGVKTNRSSVVFRPLKWPVNSKEVSPLNLVNALGSAYGKLGLAFFEDVKTFQKTRSRRNPDLSPLIRNDKHLGHMAKVMDTTRLSSLLKGIYLTLQPDESLEVLCDEFFDDSYILDVICARLLNKEPSLVLSRENPMDIPSNPIGIGTKLNHQVQSLSQDPLFRDESLKQLDGLAESQTFADLRNTRPQ